MLKKIYVDNFRCLVNFEVTLGDIALFLGHNGSGKSSVLDVLYRLKQLVSGDVRDVNLLFPQETLSRWYESDEQKFELAVEGPIGAVFEYRLVVDHDRSQNRCRVVEEKLMADGKFLYRSERGQA
jgi:AAA15 family ATPase/GTPase